MPWHTDGGDEPSEPPRANWSEHRRVVPQQVQEWSTLAARNPEASLVVAGDWNTDLTVGAGLTQYPYGTRDSTATLLDAVDDLGLRLSQATCPIPDLNETG